ncbi:MAG: ATP-binding protein [bacterium]
MLDYAKAIKPEWGPYNIRVSISNTIALRQADLDKAGIVVVLEEVEVETIVADRRQIEQVLVNMINNAGDAIEKKGSEGGEIRIAVRKEDPWLVIRIHDNGAGIAQEDQGRVFDPFFTTRSPRGVGLGLSVSYGIVERHGGHIDFTSDMGTGTTFRILLPVQSPVGR